MKKYVVIVAGGQGIRMKDVLPKQFMALAGKPVLMHTLSRFNFPDVERILVMNSNYIQQWADLCKEYNFIVSHRVVQGGNTRAESVFNGLSGLLEESLVAVHDAVRPLVSEALINFLFEEASVKGSAIPVIPLKDTLRELSENGSITVSRERYRAVQTPQVFHTGKLIAAFNISDYRNYTDEASLFQASGNAIHLVDGEENNLKLTVPADMLMAEAYLKGKII
jgi:2-C-methyl-D-erythritol 4-phosphate cytidylyltransferase